MNFSILLVVTTAGITKTGHGMMAQISSEDKMQIQTFREIGFGYRAIVANFSRK